MSSSHISPLLFGMKAHLEPQTFIKLFPKSDLERDFELLSVVDLIRPYHIGGTNVGYHTCYGNNRKEIMT